MEMKPINNYEDYYISDEGKVYSTISHKWIRPTVDKDGYAIVNIYKDKKRKSFRIHRLVAEAFLPVPYGAVEIDHKDRNKQNNNVSNLEWKTHPENCNNRHIPKRTKWGGYYAYKDGELLGVYNSLYKMEGLCGCNHANIYRHMIKGTPTAIGVLVIPGIWLDK